MHEKNIKVTKIPSWVVLLIMAFSFVNYGLRRNKEESRNVDSTVFSVHLDSLKKASIIVYPDSALINQKQLKELLGRD